MDKLPANIDAEVDLMKLLACENNLPMIWQEKFSILVEMEKDMTLEESVILPQAWALLNYRYLSDSVLDEMNKYPKEFDVEGAIICIHFLKKNLASFAKYSKEALDGIQDALESYTGKYAN